MHGTQATFRDKKRPPPSLTIITPPTFPCDLRVDFYGLLDDDAVGGQNKLGEANEKEHTHNLSLAVSYYDQRVGELRIRARAQAEEALKDALAHLKKRSEERSSLLKMIAATRRGVVELAMGWIDVALEANLRRLERRRCRRREEDQHRAGAIRVFLYGIYSVLRGMR